MDFSGLKLVLGGGMATQKSVVEKWHEITGNWILEAYGLTETSPAASINHPENEGFNGTIGLRIASTEIDVAGEDGKLLRQDGGGERGG